MCAKKYIPHYRKINATYGPVFVQVSERPYDSFVHFDNRITLPEPTSNDTSALNASRHWAARHRNAGIRGDMRAKAREREEKGSITKIYLIIYATHGGCTFFITFWA